jgi:flagellar protein FlaG
MDVTAIHRIASLASVATAPEQATQEREVVQAVKALNGTEMFGENNQLEFQRDPASRRMVIRVINRKTKEVVSQVPPEYVLRLARDLKEG